MQAQMTRRGSDQEGLNASELDAALTRTVQSSPAFNGSQQSPIEIEDLTPRPTRRLLFPSPRRDGEVKSLDDNGQATLKSFSPQKSMTKPGLDLTFEQTSTNIFEAFTFDKENLAPPVDGTMDDDLSYLFEGSPSGLFKTPFKTPTKSTPRSLQHLTKTPTPASRKRNPLSPNANATNGANHGNVNDFMTSPSSSRYFLRSTPSRISRTPRSGNDAYTQDVSPWSRQLAQMLSDANDPAATFTSSNQQFEFSDLPTFTTPGRALAECDWEGLEGILSSEFASYDEVQAGAGGEGDVNGEQA